MEKYLKYIIPIGIGIIVLLFLKRFTFKGKMRRLRASTKQEKKVIATTVYASEYFKPGFYKIVDRAKVFNIDTAETLVKRLRKGMKGLGTKESEIFGVFSQVRFKTQVSQLADIFYMKYKRDLATDLVKELTRKELHSLYSMLDQLPLR